MAGAWTKHAAMLKKIRINHNNNRRLCEAKKKSR